MVMSVTVFVSVVALVAMQRQMIEGSILDGDTSARELLNICSQAERKEGTKNEQQMNANLCSMYISSTTHAQALIKLIRKLYRL